MTEKRNSAGSRVGSPPSPPYPSICHLLRDRAEVLGDKEMLRSGTTSLTFSEVERASTRLANTLVASGVRRGDRVAIMLPNGIEFPLCWLAVVSAGGVVVPINVGYQRGDLGHVLQNSGASFVFADETGLPRLKQVRGQCPALRQMASFDAVAQEHRDVIHLPSRLTAESDGHDLPAAHATDLVTIQYTSGTTGFPKGCMLTHEYWLRLAGAVGNCGQITGDDVLLTAQPVYYMDPTWNLVLALLAGVPLVILPRFSPSTFWSSVTKYGATFFYCLGAMPLFLLKQPDDPTVERGHRVRLVMCSGIPPRMHATFEERWGCPWREVYGATELGCVLAVPPGDIESVGTGAMGTPVSGREVKVIDEHGLEVAQGSVGELLVRGPGMMLGYYENPVDTARWMRDGWARTGDLVFRDARGYYHLVSRIKDMIRRAGENISAAEVESVLCEHPGVRAVACIPVPDDLRGEEAKAFVQLQPDQTPDSLPPQELAAFLHRRLARFKVPRYYEYVDRFPMTPSARIAKSELLSAKVDQRAGAYDAVSGTWN